jgi:site-specific DNA-methyltransferase (adenine-specific)
VERWGTGGIEVDACRIATSDDLNGGRYSDGKKGADGAAYGSGINRRSELSYQQPSGRWPANVVLSHAETCADACVEGCPVLALDQQAGTRKSRSRAAGRYQQRDGTGVYGASEAREEPEITGSVGSASRFFYTAKPSPAERDAGLDAFEERSPAELTSSMEWQARPSSSRTGAGRSAGRRNHHPTVKSIALMRYLVRLVTPPEGLVLDPFAGSGSTGAAALLEGRRFMGIEQDPEYVRLARARIVFWEQQVRSGKCDTLSRQCDGSAFGGGS